MNTIQKKFIPLRHMVAVYVPGTVAVNAAADNAAWITKTAELLTLLYGGATCTPVLGWWHSAEAGMVTEKTTVVFAFAEALNPNGELDQVLQLVEELRRELGQEAVSLEVDHELYLIEK